MQIKHFKSAVHELQTTLTTTHTYEALKETEIFPCLHERKHTIIATILLIMYLFLHVRFCPVVEDPNRRVSITD